MLIVFDFRSPDIFTRHRYSGMLVISLNLVCGTTYYGADLLFLCDFFAGFKFVDVCFCGCKLCALFFVFFFAWWVVCLHLFWVLFPLGLERDESRRDEYVDMGIIEMFVDAGMCRAACSQAGRPE